jgi:hypothetical protein
MDKRRLHHVWRKSQVIKPWYFIILAILSGVICVFALRANNEHMVQLRNALYDADKNNGNVQQALQDLQSYVTSHMNTELISGNTSVYPPIQLPGTYSRLVEAQGKQLQQQSSPQLYTDAQAYCEKLDPVDFSGHNRVPCIEQYVQSHGGSVKITSIPDSLYKFAFVSPRWSPDLAGWSLLAAILCAGLAVVTFVARRWLKVAAKSATQT